jgi:phosphoribosylanthranilate isomerase
MRVKVCGIRRIKDALDAVRFGADAVGLLVGQKQSANDFINEGLAKLIAQKLPPYLHMTGT